MDDELRDMENELNMSKHMQQMGKQEELKKIAELQAQLE